jgi:hypothetical protein
VASVDGGEPGPVAAYGLAVYDGDGEEQVIDLAARVGTSTGGACAAAPSGEVA